MIAPARALWAASRKGTILARFQSPPCLGCGNTTSPGARGSPGERRLEAEDIGAATELGAGCQRGSGAGGDAAA